MAVGRKYKPVAPAEVTVVSGKAGRISAPPKGAIYVRDVQVARARAAQERAKAFQDAGEEVPEALAALVAEINVGISDKDEPINLVDALTGELLAEGAIDEEGVVLEEEAAGESESEPEPVSASVTVHLEEAEPEPELEAVPGATGTPVEIDVPLEELVEATAESEPAVDVDSLTVAELRAELDALDVEYSHDDRKADLQQKLRAALEE
jgi:hypothetical protein